MKFQVHKINLQLQVWLQTLILNKHKSNTALLAFKNHLPFKPFRSNLYIFTLSVLRKKNDSVLQLFSLGITELGDCKRKHKNKISKNEGLSKKNLTSKKKEKPYLLFI